MLHLIHYVLELLPGYAALCAIWPCSIIYRRLLSTEADRPGSALRIQTKFAKHRPHAEVTESHLKTHKEHPSLKGILKTAPFIKQCSTFRLKANQQNNVFSHKTIWVVYIVLNKSRVGTQKFSTDREHLNMYIILRENPYTLRVPTPLPLYLWPRPFSPFNHHQSKFCNTRGVDFINTFILTCAKPIQIVV